MTETNSETTIVRPSIEEAYADLTYNDDQAIEKAFGIVPDDYMEKLYSGSGGDPDPSQVDNTADGLSTREWLLFIRALEFARLLHEGVPAGEAETRVKGLSKGEVTEIFTAYVQPEQVDPAEGKGSSGGA